MAGSIGNADGTPRLELADEATEFDADFERELDRAAAEVAEAYFRAEGIEPEAYADEDAEVADDFEDYEEPELVAEQAPDEQTPQRAYFPRKFTKKELKEAEERVGYMLMVFEGAMIVWAGEDARLLPHERKLILEPASRMLARSDPRVMQAIERYTDPIMLLFGLSAYTIRVLSTVGEDDDGPPPRRPPSETPEPPGPNGRTVEEVIGVDDPVLRAGPSKAILSQVDNSQVLR